jgi:hypothetical protein
MLLISPVVQLFTSWYLGLKNKKFGKFFNFLKHADKKAKLTSKQERGKWKESQRILHEK